MFYEQSDIADLLRCEHCKQFYDEYEPPKILPCCEKTICGKCVEIVQKNIKNNKFKCISCNEEDTMPRKGFLVNKQIAKLIEKQPKDIHRGDEAEKLKSNIKSLEETLKKYLFEIENGEYLIKEDCKELERQVQLAKEKRIEEIEKQTDVLLKQINGFQETCIQKYNEMKEPEQKAGGLINEVNNVIQHNKTYLQQLTLRDNETINSNNKLKEIKDKLETKREQLKVKMFDNKSMKFEPNNTPIDVNLLGILQETTVSTVINFINKQFTIVIFMKYVEHSYPDPVSQ